MYNIYIINNIYVYIYTLFILVYVYMNICAHTHTCFKLLLIELKNNGQYGSGSKLWAKKTDGASELQIGDAWSLNGN